MPYRDHEKRKKYAREWKRKEREKLRMKAIKILGGKCAKCNEDDLIVLEIDHINPILRGRNELMMSRKSGINLTRKIVSGKVSIEEYQLLCANCHRRKTFKERKKYKNYIK